MPVFDKRLGSCDCCVVKVVNPDYLFVSTLALVSSGEVSVVVSLV